MSKFNENYSKAIKYLIYYQVAKKYHPLKKPKMTKFKKL